VLMMAAKDVITTEKGSGTDNVQGRWLLNHSIVQHDHLQLQAGLSQHCAA
jgi:hypothetical protein